MHAGRLPFSCALSGFSLLILASPLLSMERATTSTPTAGKAHRSSRVVLELPFGSTPVLSMQDSTLGMFCFDNVLDQVINPGCFTNPAGGGGDCTSAATHFMAQFFDPFDYLGDFAGTWRVKEVRFITNDGDTTWPSVGIVRQPFDNIEFPTTAELQALQATNVASPADTAEVVVDLRAANIVFTVDHVFFMVLQFPAGGRLTAPLQGPGILADDKGVNTSCDFLTLDTGTTWLSPEPTTDPLDWGFAVVIEPVTAVEERSWGTIKRLYGGDSLLR